MPPNQEPLGYSAINSFTRRPCFTQICSYVIVATQAVIFYVLVRPHLASLALTAFTAVFSVLLGVVVVSGAVCSTVDPSDSLMVQCKISHRRYLTKNSADRWECDNCRTEVSQDVRHCKQCSRCVQGFDHHCIWINNCIGAKNYKVFIVMIASTWCYMSCFLAGAFYLTAQMEWDNYYGEIIAVWVIACCIAIFWFLLLNLNLLHIYLMNKGFTTFQFYQYKRQQEAEEKLKEEMSSIMHNQNITFEQLKQKAARVLKEKQKAQIKEKDERQGTVNEMIKESEGIILTPSKKIKPSEQDEQETAYKNMFFHTSDKFGFDKNEIVGADSSNRKKTDSNRESNQPKEDVSVNAESIGADKQQPSGQRLQFSVQQNEPLPRVRMSSFFIKNKSLNFWGNQSVVSKPKKSRRSIHDALDEQEFAADLGDERKKTGAQIRVKSAHFPKPGKINNEKGPAKKAKK